MGTLVVITSGDGNFQEGFPCWLHMSEEGGKTYYSSPGRLPPQPELPQSLLDYQNAYYNLATIRRARIPHPRFDIVENQVTNISEEEGKKLLIEYQRSAEDFSLIIKTWLRKNDIQDLKFNILDRLNKSEFARIIIATKNVELRQIPWHLWDLFKQRPNSEVSFSMDSYGKPHVKRSPKTASENISSFG